LPRNVEFGDCTSFINSAVRRKRITECVRVEAESSRRVI
jgi:hypothetical protein